MYALRVIHTWLGYSYSLICIIPVGNWFVFVTAVEETGYPVAFIGFVGNAFVWVTFNRFMSESIDDLAYHKQDFGTPLSKMLLSRFNSAFWGVVLFPLMMWPFSFQNEMLWGNERSFWFQPGQYIFATVGATLPLCLSKILTRKQALESQKGLIDFVDRQINKK